MSNFTNQTISIENVFKNFYQVPDYQRGYVWDQERVGGFLEDLLDFKENIKNKPDYPEFFIGASVFQTIQQSDDKEFYVVDGQQRLTTIFILACAVVNQIREIDPTHQSIKGITDDYLKKIDWYSGEESIKIKPSDKSGNAALVDVMAGNFHTPEDATKSAENIYDAYRTCREFLKSKLLSDKPEKSIKNLSELIKLFNKVRILPFISKGKDESLSVFETLNSKGVGLSSLDIIKSYLFDNTNESDWQAVNDAWTSFNEKYEKLNFTPNKFLRYLIITEYKNTSIQASKVLDWVNENPAELKKPIVFLKKMDHLAAAIYSIKKGNGNNGNVNQHIVNINALAPSSEQQYFLLLMSWNKSTKIFNEVCRAAESYIFRNKILVTYTGAIEKNFIGWGESLSKISTDDEAQGFINSIIWKFIRESNVQIESKISEVSWTKTNKSFIGWILKRAELYAIEISGDLKADGVKSFNGMQIDVEHIDSQNSSNLAPDDLHNIGNLTLLERSINRAIKDKPFEDKFPHYAGSKFFMTKSINKIPAIGGKQKQATEVFYHPDEIKWSVTDVTSRQSRVVKALMKGLNYN